MAVEMGTHREAVGFAIQRAVTILRHWMRFLIDATMISWLAVSGFAAVIGVTTPGSGIGLYLAALSVPSLLLFFVVVSALVLAGFTGLVMPEMGLFEDVEVPDYDESTYSGFVQATFKNFTAATYTTVAVWVPALFAYELAELGLIALAPWMIVAILGLEFLSFYRVENSVLSTLSASLMLLLTPIVFLGATTTYAIRQTKHVRSKGTEVAGTFIDAVGASSTPGKGSLIEELQLIRRHRR